MLFKLPEATTFQNHFFLSKLQEMPLYFQEPKQLLDIFTSLEESNLFLIQNSQATSPRRDFTKKWDGMGMCDDNSSWGIFAGGFSLEDHSK